LRKLSGDELEALTVFFVGETKYLEMLDSAIAELKENDPIRYTELAEAAPGIIVERLIADALGGEPGTRRRKQMRTTRPAQYLPTTRNDRLRAVFSFRETAILHAPGG
jgi:hypothetical protein